jgi:hypothetical protein
LIESASWMGLRSASLRAPDSIESSDEWFHIRSLTVFKGCAFPTSAGKRPRHKSQVKTSAGNFHNISMAEVQKWAPKTSSAVDDSATNTWPRRESMDATVGKSNPFRRDQILPEPNKTW